MDLGAGRQRNAPAACSRGGGSPACGVSGVPGLSLAWNLVVDVARGMRNTPMRSEQRIGVRDGVCGGGGGCSWRSIAGERGSGGARATDHQKLAPKDRTDRGVAHRGRGADGFVA